MAKIYMHWVGTAIAREKGLGNSRQESAVNQWLPSKAPDGSQSIGKDIWDQEVEVFHKLVDINTKIVLGIKVTFGADAFFKGTVEYFKAGD
jgi:hypothetical protein